MCAPVTTFGAVRQKMKAGTVLDTMEKLHGRATTTQCTLEDGNDSPVPPRSNGRFGLPKTGKRLIDLPEGLVRKLERHILDLRKEALSEGRDATYLFPGITQRIVQKALKTACRFAKLRVRHPHDLRHTYASILLMEHYSPAYVQKQLGHHSITMTVDTYGHWIPGEGKNDLDQTLGGAEKLPLKQMLKRRRSGLQRVK